LSGRPATPSPYAGNGVLRTPATALDEAVLPFPLRLRLTAAVPSKDTLSVVTLSWTGKHLRLVPTHTSFFRLASEDQDGVQQLADDLLKYFAFRDIRLLLVRRGPGTGPYSVSSGTSMIETILHLMPFPCIPQHTQAVLGWVNSADWMLPLPQRGYRSERRKLQGRAIETAAFGIAKVLEACSPGTSPSPQRQLPGRS